ncbi:MAG: hypothetical protein IKQ87_12465, partial [Clostridia bacterium]|nr:hypothetical protein [Clostridia bacterium]
MIPGFRPSDAQYGASCGGTFFGISGNINFAFMIFRLKAVGRIRKAKFMFHLFHYDESRQISGRFR